MVDDGLVGRMGVAGYDPLRIVLDVRGTGRTGYEIADALRRSYDVHLELPMQATVVFIVGLGETAPTLRRLAGDVDEVVARLSEPGATAPIVPPAASLRHEVALPPREAFLGDAEQVPVDDAVGRISCESIASYPPGVPALLPGERITAETVSYLRELAASGARLHGASDPAFQTINVLRDRPAGRRPSVSDRGAGRPAGGDLMIDPLERWAQYGEKPDYAGLLTFAGAPYTQDPAELEGFDVAVVGAPMDELVSDRPGARFAPRAIRAASCPPGPHLEAKIDAFSALRVVDFGDAPIVPADPAVSHAAIASTVGAGARRRCVCR